MGNRTLEVSKVRCQICLNFPMSQVLKGNSVRNWLCAACNANLKSRMWCMRVGKLKHFFCDVKLGMISLFSLSTAESVAQGK